MPLLEIPLNYYDDLAARFDFNDEFLSELAYYNVLYDRDAQGGELFHVYTEPFEERFFFEIIQRKGLCRVWRSERCGAPGGDGQAA